MIVRKMLRLKRKLFPIINNRRSFWLKEHVLPILYPRRCPVCGTVLAYGDLICSPCRSSLPRVKPPACYQCGKPVFSEDQELCYDCRRFPKSFVHGISLLLYNEQTRPMISDFKYHNKRSMSRYFAEEIFLRYQDFFARQKPDLIIPVPVHRHKKRTRGYNQAELLAADLAVLTGIDFIPDLLLRTADTSPQKEFSPQARLDNLSGAFSYNPKYRDLPRKKSTVLLTDDIYTTGATMEICSRVLLKAGFDKVCICSICTGVARD